MDEDDTEVVEPTKKDRHARPNNGHSREKYLPMLAKARAAKKNMSMKRDRLCPQDELWVAEYLKNGNNASHASLAIGIPKERAGPDGNRRLKRASVQAHLRKVSNALMIKTGITAENQTAALLDDYEVCREMGQMTAAMRAREMLLKLHGLLLDRTLLQIDRVDLKGILDAANARVSKVIEGEATVVKDVPPEPKPEVDPFS